MMFLTLVLLAASPSPSPAATADKLFSEGRTLLQVGNYAEACPLFAQSYALEPALGTLLNLADCREKRGELVQAYLDFNDAMAWASRNRESRREAAARSRARALKSRLAWLVLSAPEGAPELSVKVNDFSLKLGAKPQSVPVDEGESTVTVSAPGFAPETVKVNVGKARTVTLVLPRPVPVGRAEPSPPPALLPVATSPPPTVFAPHEDTRAGSSPAAVATLSAGSVLLVAGTAGLVYSFTTYNRVQRQQPGGPDALNPTVTQQQFETLRWLYPLSWAVVGVGGAGVTVGTIWSLKGSSATLSVVPTQGGVMVPVRGSF